MREALHTLAEAIALAAFLCFIALIAAPSLPFARPGAALPSRAEAPARVFSPPARAGRDAIAVFLASLL